MKPFNLEETREKLSRRKHARSKTSSPDPPRPRPVIHTLPAPAPISSDVSRPTQDLPATATEEAAPIMDDETFALLLHRFLAGVRSTKMGEFWSGPTKPPIFLYSCFVQEIETLLVSSLSS